MESFIKSLKLFSINYQKNNQKNHLLQKNTIHKHNLHTISLKNLKISIAVLSVNTPIGFCLLCRREVLINTPIGEQFFLNRVYSLFS